MNIAHKLASVSPNKSMGLARRIRSKIQNKTLDCVGWWNDKNFFQLVPIETLAKFQSELEF